MTSAERFANSSPSYWNGVLPRLEHFVRMSNMGPQRIAPPMEVSFGSERQAFVSEAGFYLWAGRSLAPKGFTIEAAQDAARERLLGLEGEDAGIHRLTREERRAARTIASRLETYVSTRRFMAGLEVEPQLRGCGIVGGGRPDMVITERAGGSTSVVLIEVKAVDRTFRSSDFRQLTVYAALFFSQRGLIPDALGVFNPVRGTALEVGIDEYFRDSSGAAADEVIQSLVVEWSSYGLSP